MRKKTLRYTSYVLIIALQLAILPFQHIFHHHHSATAAPESKNLLLKKFEKPCCEQYEVTIEATIQHPSNAAPHQIHAELYLTPSFSYSFLANLQLANKAPPLV